MRIRTTGRLARVALIATVSAWLAFGVVGCGGGSGSGDGSSSPLPPEAKQANENMENFMKNQQAK